MTYSPVGCAFFLYWVSFDGRPRTARGTPGSSCFCGLDASEAGENPEKYSALGIIFRYLAQGRMLFISQGFNGVESRGLDRREVAEDHADGCRKEKGSRHDLSVEDERHAKGTGKKEAAGE
jgi:hypothetical protein